MAEARDLRRGDGGVTFSVEVPCAEESRRPHDACFLCQKPLRQSSDVFMYRGDTPFCSEDCRKEQIDLDEARERGMRHRRRSRNRRGAEKTPQAPDLASLQPVEAVVAG